MSECSALNAMNFSSEDSLSCCAYCVTGHPVLMPSPGFLTVTYVVTRSLMKLLLPCFYNDRSVAVGTRTLNLPHISIATSLMFPSSAGKAREVAIAVCISIHSAECISIMIEHKRNCQLRASVITLK